MAVASFRRPNKMSSIGRKNRTNLPQVPDMVFISDGRRRHVPAGGQDEIDRGRKHSAPKVVNPGE
jgi:hypothetical protein